MKALGGGSSKSSIDFEVQSINNLLPQLGHLNDWRRKRVHPRIQIDHNGFALFDARTGRPLSIHPDECRDRAQEAIQMGMDLHTHVKNLVSRLESYERFEKLLDEVSSVTENAKDEDE